METDAPSRTARVARQRALMALVAMGLGFVIARHWRGWVGGWLDIPIPSAAWFGAALVLAAGCILARRRAAGAMLFVTLLVLSAGWFTLRILERPSSRLVLPEEPTEVLVTVEGVVVEPPSVPTPRGALARFAIGGTSQRMLVQIRRVADGDAGEGGEDRLRWRDATGRLIVRVDGPVDAPIGRRVRISGRASSVGPPTNPGQIDARLWAAQDGVVGTMQVPDLALVESASVEPGLLDPVTGALRTVRAWLSGRARAGLDHIESPRARALAASLLLGVEEEQGREITTKFQRLGLAHVLAISGVHIAMLAWATLLGIRLFGDFGAVEPALAALAVVLYLLVVPAESPIVRSGVMVLALLAGDALGRRYDGVVILAWTAAVLLAIRPMDLWSLGFQLSFGVTGVLLGSGRAFHARVFGAPSPLRETTLDQPWWRSLIDGAARAASASGLAWAVASAWIAARVGLIAPLAPVSSLIVGVPISLLMIGGFLALLIGTLVPGGSIVWSALEPVSGATLACVDWLDALPGSSMATGSVPLVWGGAASVGVLWLLTGARWRAGPEASTSVGALGARAGSSRHGVGALNATSGWIRRCRRTLPWLVAAALGVWLLLSVTVGRGLARDVALRLDTLDVGDATCHVVRSGGEVWLWDCGDSWAGAGEVRIPGAIRALGTPPVSTVVITHANFDHFNCLPDVAWRLGVRRVVVSRFLLEEAARSPGGATAAMLRMLRDQGVEIVRAGAGNRYRLGEATLEFLWPRDRQAEGLEANDQSLVARVGVNTEDGWRQILLTGDIESGAIEALLGGAAPVADGPNAAPIANPLASSVLELPHHGAFTRSAAALVERVDPEVVVQSTGTTRVGLSRARDTRWDETLEGIDRLCTAQRGAAWVEIRRDGTVHIGAVDDAAAGQ